MNCEAVREMLWAYLEKETTAEETVKIEEHLNRCAACREEFDLQKEMMETLAGLPEVELPEGYHAELMQKLRVETAPNVVAFPQKKKKQPMWKQMSMVAAAVMVVVAAGGMNGMLEMKESQNAAVQEMKVADMASPIEASGEEFAVYDGADATEMYLKDMDGSVITYQSSKDVRSADAKTAANDSIVYDGAAVEEAAQEPMAIVRTAEVQITDKVVLICAEPEMAKLDLKKSISLLDGYEEPTEEENKIIAVIPAGAFEAFVAEMENVGTMEWTQKGKVETDAAYRIIEIQLK